MVRVTRRVGRGTYVSTGCGGALALAVLYLITALFLAFCGAVLIVVFAAAVLVDAAAHRRPVRVALARQAAYFRARRTPITACAFAVTLGVVLAVGSVARHSTAVADAGAPGTVECRTISYAYRQWTAATTGGSPAQDAAATLQFQGIVDDYQDAAAAALGERLGVLYGDLMGDPGAAAVSAQASADARSMRVLADRYEDCG